MAEVMISDQYRSSLQSLENLAQEQPTSQHMKNQPAPSHTTNMQKKQVTHGPTVVIQIPQSKRRKVSSLSTKQVVEAISTAVSSHDRKEALSEAIASFDHNLQSLHDEELQLGADAVLVKHLGFVISQGQEVGELSSACEAIEMVYRASPQVVSKSFSRFGPELLGMMIQLVNRENTSRANLYSSSLKENSEDQTECDNTPNQENATKEDGSADTVASRSVTPPSPALQPPSDAHHHSDLLLKKATKVMGHFARVGAATQPMAYFSGTLGCLVSVLLSEHPLPAEVRLNSLWVLANLACNSDNMVMMACHPNLVASLTRNAALKLSPEDRASPERALEVFRTQSIATRALVNLSWAPENRIPLAECQELLHGLCPLVLQRISPFSRGRTLREIMLQSRRHSIGILRNLASAPRRTKLILLETSVGLLDTLVDAALNDTDMEVKEKAYATIHNLACQDTANLLVQNPALVLALKSALSEENTNIKTPARETLTVLERSIGPGNPSYGPLQGLLDSDNPASSAEIVSTSDFSTSDHLVITSTTPV